MKRRWHPVHPIWVAVVSLLGWPLGLVAGAVNGYLLGRWGGMYRALSVGGAVLLAELIVLVLIYGLLPAGPDWVVGHYAQIGLLANLLVGCGMALGQWRSSGEEAANRA